jgi:tellurite resistance protein TerC
MHASLAAWVALVAGVAGLLLLDLLVLHRGEEEVSLRGAGWATVFFVAVGIGFGGFLWAVEGSRVAGQYLAGYLLEESLSLDNVFVWALILSTFRVPAADQHRVLLYGIAGSLVLRGAFVAIGAQLLSRFEWVVYVFGALLLWSAARMLRGAEPRHPRHHPAVRLLRANLPTIAGLMGSRLVVRRRDVPADRRPDRAPLPGGWYVTPLVAVVVVIALTDVLFAVDSIPAIFGVTREPFLVFSATALALIGLRSMYFLLAGMRERFAHLDTGLAIILAFVGAKFLLTDVVDIGTPISLAVIVAVLAASASTSLVRPAGP